MSLKIILLKCFPGANELKKVIIQMEKWSLWVPGHPLNDSLNNSSDNLDAIPFQYQQHSKINEKTFFSLWKKHILMQIILTKFKSATNVKNFYFSTSVMNNLCTRNAISKSVIQGTKSPSCTHLGGVNVPDCQVTPVGWLAPTHWSHKNMAAILQTTFSNEFYGIKIFIY